MTVLLGPPTTTSVDVYVPQLVLDGLEADGADAEARTELVEGSLVFADVSGFTPLSERLARLRRRHPAGHRRHP